MTDIIFVDTLSGVGYRNINLLLGLYIVSKYSDALTCGSIFLGIIISQGVDFFKGSFIFLDIGAFII